MKLKVLSLFATFLLSNLSSCHNTESSKTSWLFRLPRIMPENRIGKQMPPHHEPDAVLINVGGGNGQPGMPGGNAPRWPQPGGPGVFIPGGPGVFGVPGMPGVYGVPGGTFPRPDVFGFPGSPNFPNGFGAPGGFRPPRGPNDPGVFVTPRQDYPHMPSGPNASDIPVGHNGHGFSVGTGVIGVPNGHSRPNEPTGFGHPSIFTISRGGNVPVSAVPGYFVPGQHPNFQTAPGSFPGNGGMVPGSFPGNGGMVPETFSPGGTGRFGPGGTYPGVYFPEAAPAPHNPGVPDSFGGSFPGKEFHGGEGGRELNDDPVADMFPIIDKEPLFYGISS